MNKGITYFFASVEPDGEKLHRRVVGTENFKKKLAGSYFYVFVSSMNEFVMYFVELWDSSLVFRKGENLPMLTYIDLNFLQMKKRVGNMGRKELMGINIANKVLCEEIYTDNSSTFEKWWDLLKKICLQPKFGEGHETVKVLAQGLNSKIFQVRKLDSGTEFAVKVFDKRLVMNKDLDSLLVRNEVTLLRMAEHPNLIRMVELYEGDTYIYCVMDFCKGKRLFDEVSEKRSLPEGYALKVLRKVLEALVWLHSKHIVHRDVKLENILFRGKSLQEGLCLVDLGFAVVVDEAQKILPNCGTPGYTAPEVLLKQPYDTKADVFSLGVVFYIMLTGREPFAAPTEKLVVEKNRACKINFSFAEMGLGFTPLTVDLLRRMLAFDPRNRPTSSECLAHLAFNSTEANVWSVPPNNLPYALPALTPSHQHYNIAAIPENRIEDLRD